MNEVKPIVVIYLPENIDGGSGRIVSPSELMAILNNPNDYWKDYLWFVFFDNHTETPHFKVFYPKDFTDIQYEELKQLIENKLKQLTA